jgi:hypothetical protein
MHPGTTPATNEMYCISLNVGDAKYKATLYLSNGKNQKKKLA